MKVLARLDVIGARLVLAVEVAAVVIACGAVVYAVGVGIPAVAWFVEEVCK